MPTNLMQNKVYFKTQENPLNLHKRQIPEGRGLDQQDEEKSALNFPWLRIPRFNDFLAI